MTIWQPRGNHAAMTRTIGGLSHSIFCVRFQMSRILSRDSATVKIAAIANRKIKARPHQVAAYSETT